MPFLRGLKVTVEKGLGRFGEHLAEVGIGWRAHQTPPYLPVGRE